jgi:hypothetical protein
MLVEQFTEERCMSKPKFDIDLFWNLPTCTHLLINGDKYCAMGAAGIALDRPSVNYDNIFLEKHDWSWYLLDRETRMRIININNFGVDESKRDIRRDKEFCSYDVNNPHPNANPERAKRILVEYLLANDLVEFTNLAKAEQFVKEKELVS